VKKKRPAKRRSVPLSELALMSEKSKKFDSDATQDSCVFDLRKLQNLHPAKSITRNFYRVNGKYSDSTWNQFFGTFLEFKRQAGLELTRNQHSLERKIAKHASLDVYRYFYTSEVLPYHRKFDLNAGAPGRFKTILTGSDFHDEDADPFVLGVFIDTAERIQPNVICLNGDIFDNPEFSRFNLDPRNFRIRERFQFVKERIFGPLRKKCPTAQIDLIIGNHEYRILKLLADKTPAVKVILSDVMGLSLSDVFGLEEFQINLIAKLDLAAFSNPDIKDELRENFEVYYSTYAATHIKDPSMGISGTSGHTHRPETDVFSNVPMGKCSWVNTGSIAKCNAEYIENMDKAQNSFVIATVDTLKSRVAQNHVMIPDDVALVEGKLYFRTGAK
jgi:hypothetical protein